MEIMEKVYIYKYKFILCFFRNFNIINISHRFAMQNMYIKRKHNLQIIKIIN